MTRVLQALLIIVACLLLVHTLIYLAYGIALIAFPFDYDQAEGFELTNAALLAEGRCLYCDSHDFPYYASGYPPLFHLLLTPLVKLFGAQFWYGRLLVFCATFVTAAAIALAVQRESRQPLIALIAGLAFLSSNFIYHIGPLLRQHLLMVMFEALAVVAIARAVDGHGPRQKRALIIGGVCLLCAGYSKQLAYATCAAAAIWLFLRHPGRAIRFSGVLIFGAGLIFALFMLTTGGHWWTNIISANQNPYDLDQFLGLLRQFLRLHGWLLVLAAALVAYELFFARLSIYAIWLLAALLNSLAAGKWGAGDSYFATALAATCILSGIFLARSMRRGWTRPDNAITRSLKLTRMRLPDGSLALMAALLFLAYGLAVFKMPTSGPIFAPIARALRIEPLPGWRYPLYDPAGWTVGYAVTGHLPSPQDLENGWQIVDLARASDGLLLSEDAGFSILSGKQVIGNGVQLKNLWENGLYDPAELVALLEERAFGLVILRARLLPIPVLDAIERHYALSQRIGMNGFDYELWRPRDPAANGAGD